MNAYSYQLNSTDAREGSGGGGGRVAQTGAYEGVFTKAKFITAQTGAAGIEFEFESNAREHARFTLYTHNRDGQAIYGFKQLQALMAVLKLRSLTAKVATIEEYNYDSGQKEKVQAEIYPDMQGKPVGVVFQMEEYVANSGDLKMRPNFYAPFEPATRRLAVEILDQSPAERLDKILATLKDKPLQVKPQSQPAAPTPSAGELINDDIPF